MLYMSHRSIHKLTCVISVVGMIQRCPGDVAVRKLTVSKRLNFSCPACPFTTTGYPDQHETRSNVVRRWSVISFPLTLHLAVIILIRASIPSPETPRLPYFREQQPKIPRHRFLDTMFTNIK